MTSERLNNFDLIRLIAAVLVWYAHCYELIGDSRQPFTFGFLQLTDLGIFGVTVFFIISGYFVTASFARSETTISFARNRALRVLPGLVVVVFLTVFILGPLVTSLSISGYLQAPQTWCYLESLEVFGGCGYELPGVFTNNFTASVNGSLWTLPYEIEYYFIVAYFGHIRLLRSPMLLLTMLIGSLFKMPFLIAFSSGSLAYLLRNFIKFNVAYLTLAIMLMVGADRHLLPYQPCFDLGLSYVILYCGFFPWPQLRRLTSRLIKEGGDWSYGFYLYAYPVQQTTLHLLGTGKQFPLFMAASFFGTLFFAFLSWRLVEKPALAFKARHQQTEASTG